MSGDEGQDVELRELVSQTLENNGVLPKIRAELRASVFLALEDQDGATISHFVNKPLKAFASTTDGALVLSLVRELLEYFELDNTLAVFNPETRQGADYPRSDRDSLAKDLALDCTATGPLLSQVIRGSHSLADKPRDNAADHSLTDKPRDNTSSHSLADKPHSVTTSHGPADKQRDNVIDHRLVDKPRAGGTHLADKPHGGTTAYFTLADKPRQQQAAERHETEAERGSLTGDGLQGRGATPNTVQPKPLSVPPSDLAAGKTANLANGSRSPEPVKQLGSLLGNLPPLSGSGGLTGGAPIREKREELSRLDRDMLALGLESLDNNYEEDFASSPSHSKTTSNNSEIEEDVQESIGDDAPSTKSALDDGLTVDATLSNTSAHCDHVEDL